MCKHDCLLLLQVTDNFFLRCLQVKRLEQMLRESQVATDRVQKEFNILNEKVQKLHHDLEDQIHTNTQLLAENSQKALELKQKEDEILQVKVGVLE